MISANMFQDCLGDEDSYQNVFFPEAVRLSLPSKCFSCPVDLEQVRDNLDVMSIFVKAPIAAKPVAKQLSTGELKVVRND